ncbi:uncharacterized protein TNCV_4300931 [Trichonephila clavipes]|nr:uncharacterized protein TNCV_4300931 [Trichonephila clavipes]
MKYPDEEKKDTSIKSKHIKVISSCLISRGMAPSTTWRAKRITPSSVCCCWNGIQDGGLAFFFFPLVAAVAEWYRNRTVAYLVTSSSPVPLKTRRVGQRCTLNLPRAETSSRWCGAVVRRGGASSGVVHVT